MNPRPALTAALVAAYLLASTLPCDVLAAPAGAVRDGAPVVADHHAHGHEHEHHGEAEAEHGGHAEANAPEAEHSGHCHEPPKLAPRCPCGCDESSDPRVIGGQLDPTVLEEPVAPFDGRPIDTPRTRPLREATNVRPTDKVPIVPS